MGAHAVRPPFPLRAVPAPRGERENHNGGSISYGQLEDGELVLLTGEGISRIVAGG